MNIRTFELERVQSLYENTVPINLTESGFHPYTLKELLSAEQIEMLTETVLGYGQTNGSIPLRQTISDLYPNCNEDHVLVTNGSAEANLVACHTLLDKGDEVIMMVPNYMQIWGIVEEMGCTPKKFHLREENNWQPDLDELESLMTSKTKMIAVCNPNNPTGYVMSLDEMKAIIAIAKKYDCWIYSDEVYRGADLDGIEKPSFYGMYEKVLVKELMANPQETISPKEPMDQVMKKFDETGAWNLPVIEDGIYLGFISKSSVLANYRSKLKGRSIR